MPNRTFLEIMDLIVLLLLFVGAPALAIVIAIKARRSTSRNFSREAYWTTYVLTLIVAILLIMGFLRSDLDGTWHIFLHFACGIIGAVVFGVAAGFLLGVFVSRGPIFTPSPPPKK